MENYGNMLLGLKYYNKMFICGSGKNIVGALVSEKQDDRDL